MRRLRGLAVLAVICCAGAAPAAEPRPRGIEACARCHGDDGIATDPATPHLAGLDAAYLTRQFGFFADNRRRNEDMATLAGDVDSASLTAISRWYAGRRPPAAGTPGSRDAGQRLYEEGNGNSAAPACATCHQPDAGGNARFPRLAGQKKPYLVKQLNDFKSGRRATDPQMAEVARGLSAADIQALADYLGGR